MTIQHTSATIVSLTALLSAFATGCSDASTRDPAGEVRATIQGKIESDANIQADTIVATQLGGGRVSTGDAELGADGSYTLAVNIPDPSAGPLVISAQTAGEATGSVLVSVASTSGDLIQAPPINIESSVEVEVHASLAVGVQLPALKLLVDDTTARAVAASEAYAADVQATADGVAAASLAFEQALQAQATSDVSAQLALAHDDAASALATLDHALFTATTQAEATTALEIYARAYLTAYANAGFSHDALSTAALAAIDGMEHYAQQLTSDAHAAALAHANGVFAEAVGTAIEAQLVIAGAAQTSVDAVAQARAQLAADLAQAASAGAQAEADVAAAWAAYSSAVEATLADGMDLGAELIDGIKLSLAEAEQSLDTEIANAAGSADAVAATLAHAHADYRSETTADTSAFTTVGLSDAEAHAAMTIIATISITDG